MDGIFKRKAKFLNSSASGEGFLSGAPTLFAKDKVRIEPFLENNQFYVLEKLVVNGVTEETKAGPFQNSDECSAYAEQRYKWYLEKVLPLYGSNLVADPFVFSYPPP